MQEAGMPPRDIASYSAWRDTAPACVLDALNIYGTYLINQSNGMSDALDLTAVVAAMELEDMPKEDRPDMAILLLLIHARCREIVHKKTRKVGHA